MCSMDDSLKLELKTGQITDAMTCRSVSLTKTPEPCSLMSSKKSRPQRGSPFIPLSGHYLHSTPWIVVARGREWEIRKFS